MHVVHNTANGPFLIDNYKTVNRNEGTNRDNELILCLTGPHFVSPHHWFREFQSLHVARDQVDEFVVTVTQRSTGD